MENAAEKKIVADSVSEIHETQSWWSDWFKWCPTSMSHLVAAEKNIMSYVKTAYHGRFFNIGPVVGNQDNKIWTLSMSEKSPNTPLVMIHGLGAGVALWCMNLDTLAATRPVHTFDLLGFGRSSRPSFSSDALEAERQLVQSIEEWRREMKLERFVLLGHSLGGFLAASYAIRYPRRIAHLILADPWGFPEKPSDIGTRYAIPFWVLGIAYLLQPLNPLWGLRVAGPFGPKLIEKARPDLLRKFTPLVEENQAAIANYIFHCNVQNPTGESAFHAMMSSYGWAKFPMLNRIDSLHVDVPITMIYGSRSWIDHGSASQIQQLRPNSFVDVQIINGAGHHVYADKYEQFNAIVSQACENADMKKERRLHTQSSRNHVAANVVPVQAINRNSENISPPPVDN